MWLYFVRFFPTENPFVCPLYLYLSLFVNSSFSILFCLLNTELVAAVVVVYTCYLSNLVQQTKTRLRLTGLPSSALIGLEKIKFLE